jgi:hypothetical protein
MGSSKVKLITRRSNRPTSAAHVLCKIVSMKTVVKSKYIFLSAMASFIIPILLMVLVFLYGFGPPESDSDEIQGFVVTLMLFPVIFLFQLVAYWVTGKYQVRRSKPSLVLGSAVGAILAVPLFAIVFAIAFNTGATLWEAMLGSVLFMFLPLWVSFTLGSSVQYYLMVRDA